MSPQHLSPSHTTTPLVTPSELRRELPLSSSALRTLQRARSEIQAVVRGHDPRLLAIVGPCSVHDPEAAFEYAQRLVAVQRRHADVLLVCMRAYFEKPRTTVGWKGLVNDPHLDGSCDLGLGLRIARELLRALTDLGLPVACETLDPLATRYLADLMAWSAIGARTTESQTHREMASGLAMAVGFKNGTDGSFDTALHAIKAAAAPHSFFGVDDAGRVSAVRTRGNPHGHLVLRGGRSGPNYGASAVAEAARQLSKAGLAPRMLVDCSHDNSQRDPRNQPDVARAVAEQVAHGSSSIFGVMLESNLVAGRQDLVPGCPLVYGQSITDGCIDFATTERVLDELADAARARMRARAPSTLACMPA